MRTWRDREGYLNIELPSLKPDEIEALQDANDAVANVSYRHGCADGFATGFVCCLIIGAFFKLWSVI